ncbi:DUF1772 domain-containing protein [Catelliglobosispora koreensis]|uniref:DUF1772 domain-containing protein n=1 Tax=Catelliglobosispora koreensis TaxID=129052 RepID=UPI00035C4958|nr:DUF1772 domain-containing protein [Catelliglobosispora koreensis]
MNILTQLIAAVAVLSAAAIYGTDMLGALVMRPTWTKVDDRTLAIVAGHSHYYGDRRFPIPGILSIVATVLATATSAFAELWLAFAAGAVATIALLTWLTIYKRVNEPINREFTAAVREDRMPDNTRELQTRWDSVIVLRVTLQGIALAALCAVLVLA